MFWTRCKLKSQLADSYFFVKIGILSSEETFFRVLKYFHFMHESIFTKIRPFLTEKIVRIYQTQILLNCTSSISVACIKQIRSEFSLNLSTADRIIFLRLINLYLVLYGANVLPQITLLWFTISIMGHKINLIAYSIKGR